MDTKELNKIPIKDYLIKYNILAVKERGYYGMYRSPFREDKIPSMKVDYNKNLWIDFGTGEGGTMIDLVMKLENCTVKRAIEILESIAGNTYVYNNTLYIPQISFSESNKQLITIDKAQPLVNKALIYYLAKRKINIGVAKRYCEEVYYTVKNKPYYAVGFKNDSGGYELRNAYFKGSTDKEITSLLVETEDECNLFEGFMNFLSYLTYNKIKTHQQSVIVLNSVTNLQKAIPVLESYKLINSYLDNDAAGKSTYDKVLRIDTVVHDKSDIYAPFNDFNDFLCGK